MTIFDVIRYPISDIPTSRELDALPWVVFERWAVDIYNDQYMRGRKYAVGEIRPWNISSLLRDDISEYQRNEYVNELRLRIKEIE